MIDDRQQDERQRSRKLILNGFKRRKFERTFTNLSRFLRADMETPTAAASFFDAALNSTETPGKKHDYWQKSHNNVTAILPVYFVILLFCLSGNILVCLTVLRNKKMRGRWYLLLVNLSIADMGLALSTPIQLLQFVNIDIGEIGCKCAIFSLDVFFGTALLILAYISLDRYNGICARPLKMNESRVSGAVIIPLIWLAASLAYAPMIFACRRSTKIGKLSCDCHSIWPKEEYYTAYAFFIVMVTYLIPFSTMVFCYFKIFRKLWRRDENSMIPLDPTGSKRRSVRMLMFTTLIFFLCWTPYNCLYILKKLKLVDPKTLGKMFLFSQVLGFANSAWNPFLYCIFSKNFREGFKSICCCRRKRYRSRSLEEGRAMNKNSRSQTLTDTAYSSSVNVSKDNVNTTPSSQRLTIDRKL